MSAHSLVDGSTRTLLDAFAAGQPTPGGGSAGALAGALAAALVERCAAASGQEPQRARAGALRAALIDVADDDVRALADLVDVLRAPGGDVAAAASRACEPAVRLRATAAELATLAGELERDGAPAYRGEARSALLLAEAAAGIAGSIVALNDGLVAR